MWPILLTTSELDCYGCVWALFHCFENCRIRGTLGSIAQLCRNVGMLTAYILSAIFDYNQLPYLYIIIPIVYMINFMSLPNTPQYLVRKGKFEVKEITGLIRFRATANIFSCLQFQKAEKALKYYKGCNGATVAESAAISQELERLKSLANQRQANKKLLFSDFCKWLNCEHTLEMKKIIIFY